MNSFILEEFDAEFPYVTYYTVRWEGDELSETDKFIERFQADIDYKEEYDEIAELLRLMGEEHCALDIFFRRFEDEASALPPSRVVQLALNYGGNRLRLYCIKITDHIVVLFNGGIKSARTAQESPDLVNKFRDAKTFASKIWTEIHNEMIVVDDPRHSLKYWDSSDEIIIY